VYEYENSAPPPGALVFLELRHVLLVEIESIKEMGFLFLETKQRNSGDSFFFSLIK
jgi:hypothetical protein